MDFLVANFGAIFFYTVAVLVVAGCEAVVVAVKPINLKSKTG